MCDGCHAKQKKGDSQTRVCTWAHVHTRVGVPSFYVNLVNQQHGELSEGRSRVGFR